jgi:hypothetical protein
MRRAKKESPQNLRSELSENARIARFSESEIPKIETALKTDENKTRIDQAIAKLRPFVKYTEAARAADSNGTTIQTELGGDWTTVRQSVVDSLIRDGKLLERFPELEEIASEAGRRDFIEELITRDPRFQHEIATKLNKVLTDTKDKLTADDSVAEIEKLKKTKTPIENLQTALIARLKSTLSDQGLTDEQNDQLENFIRLGSSPEQVMRQASLMIRNNKNVDPVLIDYKDNEQNQKDAQREEEEASEQLVREKANINTKNQQPSRPQEIKKFEDLILIARRRKANAETNMKATRDAYVQRSGITDADFDSKYQEFISITSFLGEGSPLLEDMRAASDNQTQINGLDSQIKTLESDPTIKQKAEQRDKDRESLTIQLEGVIQNSLGSFLEQKYDDYLADQEFLLKVAIKDAEKNGETWYADSAKKIQDSFDRLSKFDTNTRKWDRDKGEIGTALHKFTQVAASGKDGAQAFIAEAVGFNLDEKVQKDSISQELYPGKTYDNLTPDEKMKADALIYKRKTDFDKLVAGQSEAVKKRLMGDYLAAKGFMDKLSSSPLSLTSDEIVLLENQMGPLIDKEIEKSKTGASVLRKLGEQGIKPGFKTKWLLWLLLFGGGLLATAATAGTLSSAIKAVA